MEAISVKIEIDGEDMQALLDNVHDCYYDLTGETLQHLEILMVTRQIPPSVLMKVAQWGGNDTEVREEIFAWIKDRIKKEKVDEQT